MEKKNKKAKDINFFFKKVMGYWDSGIMGKGVVEEGGGGLPP